MPIEDQAARPPLDRPRNQKALTIRADERTGDCFQIEAALRRAFLRSSGHETRPGIEARHRRRSVSLQAASQLSLPSFRQGSAPSREIV